MKISEVIVLLELILREYGDLKIEVYEHNLVLYDLDQDQALYHLPPTAE